MNAGDAMQAEWLNEVWDAQIAGRLTTDELDDTLGAPMAALVDLGHALEPRPEVLDRLERRLLDAYPESPRSTLIVAARYAARSVDVRRLLPPNMQSSVSSVATGAMLALVFLSGLLVILGRPDNEKGRVVSAWPSASPMAAPLAPVSFAECNVSLLPTDYFERLKGSAPELPSQAAAVGLVGLESRLYGLQDLPTTSEEVRAEIRGALRLLTACTLYEGGPYSGQNRYGSLLSDDYHRRQLAEGVGRGIHSWRPSPVEPPTIHGTRVLADGRVLVEFADEIPFQVPGRGNGYHEITALFTSVDGAWLLDAIVDLDYRDRGSWTHEPWPQRNGTYELVLVAGAPGYKPYPDPEFAPAFFLEGGTLRFILYNITSDQRRFFIPELRVDVAVPPYETREFRIQAAAGEYSIRTYTGDERDEAAPCDAPYPGNTLVVLATPPAVSQPVETCPSFRG